MRVPFVKMQGIGNDFVVIDSFGVHPGIPERISAEQARRICDRRFGVGADQILWLKKPFDPPYADVRMEILNQDGTAAEMCGNGIRAVGLYLVHGGYVRGPRLRVETPAGVKNIEVLPEGDIVPPGAAGKHVGVDPGGSPTGPAIHPTGSVGPCKEARVRVDMGPPVLSTPAGQLLTIGSRELRYFDVNMGNPHAVIFVDQLAEHGLPDPMADLGPLIEVHPRFPKRTNVEFVQVLEPGRIRLRVWERGAGFTLACGTGACAAAVAALQTGRASGPVTVLLPGGILEIEWSGASQPVFMAGPAAESFRGEIEI